MTAAQCTARSVSNDWTLYRLPQLKLLEADSPREPALLQADALECGFGGWAGRALVASFALPAFDRHAGDRVVLLDGATVLAAEQVPPVVQRAAETRSGAVWLQLNPDLSPSASFLTSYRPVPPGRYRLALEPAPSRGLGRVLGPEVDVPAMPATQPGRPAVRGNEVTWHPPLYASGPVEYSLEAEQAGRVTVVAAGAEPRARVALAGRARLRVVARSQGTGAAGWWTDPIDF